MAYEAPSLGALSYGEFLFWSPNGRAAYLNALDYRPYLEVAELLRKRFEKFANDENLRATVLQKIFGPLACDPDDLGAPYMMDVKPPCSHCGSSRPRTWDLVVPPKIVDWEVHEITHNAWSAVSGEQRLARLDAEVANAERELAATR